MEQQAQRYADITADMIQGWKAKYGVDALMEYGVKVSDTRTAKFVLKEPSQNVVVAIGDKKNDETAANKILIANCILGGDMGDLENSASVYLTMLEQCNKLMNRKPVTVKKL